MNKARHRIQRSSVAHATLVSAIIALTMCSRSFSQTAQPAPTDKPYAVEYYYKTQWGHADEFIQLYKKNHYPVMKKELELGRILRISIAKPRFHSTEDGRWDFKVTIVWKNVQVTDDGFDENNLIRQLYPDQETYKREEQRRFEILLAHWDVPIVDVDPDH